MTEFAKKNLLLSKSPMSAKKKKNRNDSKIVDRKNTHNIRAEKKIVIIMSVNVTETYDFVLHSRFFHNVKKRKLSN